MPRKLIRRLLPEPDRLKNHRSLRFLGRRLHDPNLWHLNRYSVSTAVFIGLFIAFIPMPGQMLAAGALALWWRANLPISVALVWVTNPVTMPPVFYFSYRLGATLLHRPTVPLEFQPTWEWLSERLVYIWEPLLLGSVVGGLFFGLLGAALVRVLWRINVLHRWRLRRQRRKEKRRSPSGDQS